MKISGYSQHPIAEVRARINAEHRNRVMRRLIRARNSKRRTPRG